MKIPNIEKLYSLATISLARIVSEDSQHVSIINNFSIKSSKDS